jgi:hypothetical protein
MTPRYVKPGCEGIAPSLGRSIPKSRWPRRRSRAAWRAPGSPAASSTASPRTIWMRSPTTTCRSTSSPSCATCRAARSSTAGCGTARSWEPDVRSLPLRQVGDVGRRPPSLCARSVQDAGNLRQGAPPALPARRAWNRPRRLHGRSDTFSEAISELLGLEGLRSYSRSPCWMTRRRCRDRGLMCKAVY